MTEEKIPVFDIGDTLTPARQFSRKFFRSELMRQGVENPPEYPFEGFNEYDVDSIRKWVFDEELDADPEKMVVRYLNVKEKEMKERGIFEMLRQIGENIAPIGILSDNRTEAKEFFEEIFEKNEIPYETFVISQEIGVKKPKKEIFEEFLERRGVEGEQCVYFGNRGDIDSACRKTGMGFVWVTEFDTFGTDWGGEKISKLSYENVEKAMKEVIV